MELMEKLKVAAAGGQTVDRIPMGIKSDVSYILRVQPEDTRRTVVDDVGAFKGSLLKNFVVVEIFTNLVVSNNNILVNINISKSQPLRLNSILV